MKFLVQKGLLKKYSPLLISLLIGLIFFTVIFTLIRRVYYGEIPVFEEYIFPLIMGILLGGGIGLWRIQNYEFNKKIEKTLNDLKKSNELLTRSNQELSEMQQKLSQSQKMELIGIIASGVAHDLNNTLSASVNYPEILVLQYPENIKLCENLKIIKNSGMKAAAMVNDLLTLARRGVPAEQVININDIIDECLSSPEFEEIMSHHRGIITNADLEEDLNKIIGSPYHLMKTIINLISNAAEAMPHGGILTIQSYNCFLDNPVNNYETIPTGTYSVLSVKDSGGGIPDKDLLKIFEPFYTKKQMGRSGTGLGMTVIWGTVKDHHGFIDVDSVEGQGTTFSIYFPITEKKLDKRELQIHQNTIAEYKGNGELILVVDDVEDQRKIAKDLLSVLGYSVITASDGEKAVEYLKERNPDLVLLDMIMAPGIDGLDTYKKILKCNPRQKTLIVSGYAENERIKETIRLGAGKYLKKPYTLNVLGNAIKEELVKN